MSVFKAVWIPPQISDLSDKELVILLVTIAKRGDEAQ